MDHPANSHQLEQAGGQGDGVNRAEESGIDLDQQDNGDQDGHNPQRLAQVIELLAEIVAFPPGRQLGGEQFPFATGAGVVIAATAGRDGNPFGDDGVVARCWCWRRGRN